MKPYSRIVNLFHIAPLLTIGFFLFFCTLARADIQAETSLYTSVWGFPNSRDADATDLNSRLLIDTMNIVHMPFIRDTTLSVGYRYSSILESQCLSYISFSINSFRFESGLILGFRNTLPINVIPGLHEKITLELKNSMEFSAYGETSFFLTPFFSISNSGTLFDQNLFGLSSAFPIGSTKINSLYEKTEFVRQIAGGGTARNWKKKYELNVRTEQTGFPVNSSTSLGSEIAGYRTSDFYHKLIGLYIAETLIVTVKQCNFDIGARMYILTFPLKDLDSLSILSTPIFSINCGAEFPL